MVESVTALASRRDVRVEFVSYGDALQTYLSTFSARGLQLPLRPIPPVGWWKTASARRTLRALPGAAHLRRLLGIKGWHFQVAANVFDECDVVWFPWLHRHRLPIEKAQVALGSLHDTIAVATALLPRSYREGERETIRHWLASRARVVVTSQATLSTVADLFQIPSQRLSLIPVAGTHVDRTDRGALPEEWTWARAPFLLFPANTSPHKNHETVLEALGAWGADIPLVLTGHGSDLATPGDARGAFVRRYATAKGLEIGRSLIPLGYVQDEVYRELLRRAWALVVASFVEGGGSFPIMEAMQLGIPVICPDIPALREQISRTGGDVLWFNPSNRADLMSRLRELRAGYQDYKARALDQAQRIHVRSWPEMVGDYMTLIESMIGAAG